MHNRGRIDKTAKQGKESKVGGLGIEGPEKGRRVMEYLCPPLTPLLVCVLLIITLFLIGCVPVVVISPVSEPIWLDQGEVAPSEGWLVTQGWMDENIRHTE